MVEAACNNDDIGVTSGLIKAQLIAQPRYALCLSFPLGRQSFPPLGKFARYLAGSSDASYLSSLSVSLRVCSYSRIRFILIPAECRKRGGKYSRPRSGTVIDGVKSARGVY